MAINLRLKLLRRNRFDDATLTSNVTALRPLANLKDEILLRKWRGDGVSNVQVTAQLSSENPWNIGAVAVAGSNLTPAGTIKVESGTNGSTWTAQTTINAGTSTLGYGSGGYGESGYGGYGSPEDRQEPEGRVLSAFFDPVINHQWWRYTFADASNTDLFIEAGRIFAGPYLEPTLNFSNLQVALVDPSSKERSPAGVSWKDRRTIRRRVSFGWSDTTMDKSEVFSSWIFNLSKVGTSRSLIAVFMPTDSTGAKDWLAIYGEFEDLPTFQNAGHNIYTTDQIVFEEVF